MTRPQRKTGTVAPRGVLARPLDALFFLLPMILAYELTSAANRDRVVAFGLMRQFFTLFGHAGMWAPGLAVVVILLATHAASKEKWRVHWSEVGFMFLEAVALAVPLLLLNWAIPLSATVTDGGSLLDRVALGLGAGIYEELVFRLILVSVIVIIGVDVLRFEIAPVAVLATVLSALAFAAHHHLPLGIEPFDGRRFAFRAVAGAYLGVIFWYRGYGPAAGCHAAYNAVLSALATWSE